MSNRLKTNSAEINYFNKQLEEHPILSASDAVEDMGPDSDRIKQLIELEYLVEKYRDNLIKSTCANNETEIIIHDEGCASISQRRLSEEVFMNEYVEMARQGEIRYIDRLNKEVFCRNIVKPMICYLDEELNITRDVDFDTGDFFSSGDSQTKYVCRFKMKSSDYHDIKYRQDRNGNMELNMGPYLKDGELRVDRIDLYSYIEPSYYEYKKVIRRHPDDEEYEIPMRDSHQRLLTNYSVYANI